MHSCWSIVGEASFSSPYDKSGPFKGEDLLARPPLQIDDPSPVTHHLSRTVSATHRFTKENM